MRSKKPAPPSKKTNKPRTITVCGIDGCRAGWVVARIEFTAPPSAIPSPGHFGGIKIISIQIDILPTLTADASLPDCARIGIDMVIGLPSTAKPQPRQCDVLARTMLGPRRGTSIFSPPCREALAATSYKEALAINRSVTGKGISKQSYNILSKIRELDALLASLPAAKRTHIVEVHPELSFLQLARQVSGQPLAPPPPPKKTPAGLAVRLHLLTTAGLAGTGATPASLAARIRSLRSGRAGHLAADDIADALAAAWSALRSVTNSAQQLPGTAPADAAGRPMQLTI